MVTALTCQQCGKRLSKKTARLIEGRVLCSTCMFKPQRRSKTMTPLEKLDALDRTKQHAFLGLFAGASSQWHTRSDTDAMPFTGKHECQQVEPWRDFWQRELPELGFITFEEGEPFPTPGATFDSSTVVTISVTEEGWQAREAYWERVHQRLSASR